MASYQEKVGCFFYKNLKNILNMKKVKIKLQNSLK